MALVALVAGGLGLWQLLAREGEEPSSGDVISGPETNSGDETDTPNSEDASSADAGSDDAASEESANEETVDDGADDGPEEEASAGATADTEALPETSAEPIVYSGHVGGVSAAVVLPDGRVASAGDGEGLIRIWDPANPNDESVDFAENHSTSGIWSLDVLPDGRIVSGGADDGAIRVWNPTSPTTPPILFEGHGGLVSCVTALSDGRVASGSKDDDATVQVWDPDDLSAEPIVLHGHRVAVNDIIELDDRRIASAGWEASVQVWDLTTEEGSVLYTIPSVDDAEPGFGGIKGLDLTPDGTILTGGTVRLIDPEQTQVALAEYELIADKRVAIALSDGRVAVGGGVKIHIWDPSSSRDVEIFADHNSLVVSLDQLPDGRIVSGSWDSTVRIWHPDNVGE